MRSIHRRRTLPLSALIAFSAFTALFRARPASGQEPTFTLAGVVVSETGGAPVAEAQVRPLERRLLAVTDSAGRFAFPGTASGSYTIRVDRIGFAVTTVTVVVDTTDTSVTVPLPDEVLRLGEIVVSPSHFGVMGEDAVVQRQTLTREDLESVPELGEDVFRALRTVPGVAADDISTRIFVRGAGDDELLTMLDGMELYEPYHLKDFDGVFGIVDVQSVGGIDLMTGGFPVEYGDKLAGVFGMRSRVPPTSGTRTTTGLSISNMSLTSEGGFAEGRGGWLAQARRGYLDILLSLSGNNDDDEEISPSYYDIFAKAEYEVAPGNLVGLHVLHAGDDLTFRISEGQVESSWSNSSAWATWDGRLGAGSWRTTGFLGRLSRKRAGNMSEPDRLNGPTRIGVDDERGMRFAGARQDFGLEFGARTLLKAGGEVKRVEADYDYYSAATRVAVLPSGAIGTSFDTIDVVLAPSGTEIAGYAAVRTRPTDALTVEGGLRYDRVSHTDESELGPRVLAAWDVFQSTTLRASWGRYYQSHGLHELEVGDGEREFLPGDRARQLAFGVHHTIAAQLNLRVELYRRSIDRQRPRYINADRNIEAFPESEGGRVRIDPEEGVARGIEVMIDRDAVGRWAWSGYYALSEAKDLLDGAWVPRLLDQRHAFGFHLGYRPDDRWQLAATFQAHSGWPATQPTFAVDTLTNGDVLIARVPGAINNARLPAYHRLDFRATRTFRPSRGVIQLYLDVFNLYDHSNLRSYQHQPRLIDGDLVIRRQAGTDLLPRMPSIGVRWEF